MIGDIPIAEGRIMNSCNFINNRYVALICIVIILLALSACGGGGGQTRNEPPITDHCNADSVLENGTCRRFASIVIEEIPTPFVEAGNPVNLEGVFFKPLAPGRYPTLVFHHGSTGDGSNPALFSQTFFSKAIAQYFVERDWIVIFPQRRGRGNSGGTYDEGFRADRSGYSCDLDLALGGADRALADLNVITDWVRNHSDVDGTRLLIGGTSRGGILSIAHIAERPDVYLTALNFVGGWIAEGCGDHAQINRTLFVDAAAFPGVSHWLYGENDSFYSLPYSRGHFTAFENAGGGGQFYGLDRGAGLNGHFLINDPDVWRSVIDEIITTL